MKKKPLLTLLLASGLLASCQPYKVEVSSSSDETDGSILASSDSLSSNAHQSSSIGRSSDSSSSGSSSDGGVSSESSSDTGFSSERSSEDASKSSSTYLPPPDSEIEETYDVIFKDGDAIIASYEDRKVGTYVDIPVLENRDRMALLGWSGISDKAFKEGKVKVYETDMTYTAIWDEMFGTERKFDAVSLSSKQSINVDGYKDSAYEDAVEYKIESSSCQASANVYVMYDLSNIYVLAEISDQSKFAHVSSGQNVNSCDSFSLYLDLMHNDSLCEQGYTKGWGKSYRGEPGPMVEGIFKISRGFAASENARYGDNEGSVYDWRGWLSNAAKEDGSKTVGTTLETEVGYNVEYRIELSDENIPDEYKPKVGNEFGLGFVLYDQTVDGYDQSAEASSRCGLETLNLESESGPKKLSNFVYKQNEGEDSIAMSATEIRDCFKVSEGETRDKVFDDCTSTFVGDNSFEILYDEKNYYFYIKKGALTNALSVSFDGLDDNYDVLSSKKVAIGSEHKYFTVSYATDEGKNEAKYYVLETPNPNNFEVARKLYTAKYLDGEMEIDGELDSFYDESAKIDINYRSLIEKEPLQASGVAYAMFDEDYLYVFVDVTDPSVDSSTLNSSNPEQNDSVELWLSTTQTLPGSTVAWGYDNRPDKDYCGEGCLRMRAGMSQDDGFSGGHWIYDSNSVDKKVASKLTSKGYAVEYKVGWASFKDKVANGEIIDIMLLINDGENNSEGTSNRHGVVCTNKDGHNAYLNPYYLDHLQLEGIK